MEQIEVEIEIEIEIEVEFEIDKLIMLAVRRQSAVGG